MRVKILLQVSVGLELSFLVVAAVFYGWEWDTLDVGENYGVLSVAAHAQEVVRDRKAFLTTACAVSASLTLVKLFFKVGSAWFSWMDI